jgi:hypothetical protein
MFPRLASIALLIGLVGCARAGKDYVSIGDVDGGLDRGDDDVDASEPIDAAQHIDAPGGGGGGVSSTLSETADNTIDDNDALYCLNHAVGGTGDITYYRIFNPADFGITGPLQVTSVTFGVWDAESATGVTVSVGTYTGQIDQNLNLGLITNLATQGATVPDTGVGENVNTTISATIPAGSLMAVTIAAPELAPDAFVLGMSAGAQTHIGYVASNNCGVAVTNTLNQGPGSLLMSVTGTH